MNTFEDEMLNILTDLKENHKVLALKSEFEAEGATYDEVLRLKALADKAGLGLAIKIAGCEALRDLREAKAIGAEMIVAPMIESSYALKKYIKIIKNTFDSQNLNNQKFFINIETINGFNNISQILESEDFDYIAGIIFGRSDMCGSLGLLGDAVNSEELLSYAKALAQEVKSLNKEFVVGGRINSDALPFLNSISYLNKFETRKVVFDASVLSSNRVEEALRKALDFELLWIKTKCKANDFFSKEDIERIDFLEKQKTASV